MKKKTFSRSEKKRHDRDIRRILANPLPAEPLSIDPNSSAFLSSYEWRQLRFSALRKYGAKCCLCGATPATGAVMNVDHIKPRKHYPDLALVMDNLQILCGDCNHGKGNKTAKFRSG